MAASMLTRHSQALQRACAAGTDSQQQLSRCRSVRLGQHVATSAMRRTGGYSSGPKPLVYLDKWPSTSNDNRNRQPPSDDFYRNNNFNFLPDGANEEWEPYDDYEDEREPMYVDKRRVFVNREIRAQQVRLQGVDGSSIGVVALDEAIGMAREAKTDVVCINDEVKPPVCKLIKASKYKFEYEKAQKASKKKQREMQVDIKEVQLRPNTDVHDMDTKTRNAKRFLEKGSKVKVLMIFSGRELKFKDVGREVLLKFITDLESVAVPEGPVSMKGNTFSAILAPKKATP